MPYFRLIRLGRPRVGDVTLPRAWIFPQDILRTSGSTGDGDSLGGEGLLCELRLYIFTYVHSCVCARFMLNICACICLCVNTYARIFVPNENRDIRGQILTRRK